jgi:hypothetical protein
LLTDFVSTALLCCSICLLLSLTCFSQDLNRADVVEAIHANPEISWAECSGRTPYGTLVYNYTWSEVPMEPYYQYLIDSGANLKILVFSGDDDSVCGTVGTQSWIYDVRCCAWFLYHALSVIAVL